MQVLLVEWSRKLAFRPVDVHAEVLTGLAVSLDRPCRQSVADNSTAQEPLQICEVFRTEQQPCHEIRDLFGLPHLERSVT